MDGLLRRTVRFIRVVWCLLLALALAAPPLAGLVLAEEIIPPAGSDEPARTSIIQEFQEMPVFFMENVGQIDETVKYYARLAGQTVYLTGEGMVFETAAGADSAVFSLDFLGANPRPDLTPGQKDSGVASYIIGDDPSKWYYNIPLYKEVVYPSLYNGIDLRVYGHGGQLKYSFTVGPDAGVNDIALKCSGGDLTLSGGILRISSPLGTVQHAAPFIYQEIDGILAVVSGGFNLLGDNSYGFEVGDYNAAYPLIIDPTLAYSSYLGGSGDDIAYGVAADPAGNAYIVGDTASTNFPVKDAYRGTFQGGGRDIFVSKINPSASGAASLIYSTYIGGSGDDYAYSVDINPMGYAYITGKTNSTDFPVVGAVQPAPGGGFDAYYARVSPSGDGLDYSTYLGGAGDDAGRGIRADAATGQAYIAGETASATFPTKNAFQSALKGPKDVFFTKMTPFETGAASLLYSTFLGGDGSDAATSVTALFETGIAYIGGDTTSADFPVQNPFPGGGDTLRGSQDGFVAAINPASAGAVSLYYASYVGGSGEDGVRAVGICPTGCLYAAGWTRSADFHVTTPYQDYQGGTDAFFLRLSPDGTHIYYSTYLGGSGEDYINGMAVDSDAAGTAAFTGETTSPDFPGKNAYQAAPGGGKDAFAIRVNPFAPVGADTFMLFSSYLGGAGEDIGHGVAFDVNGGLLVAGQTASANFPLKNAYQTALAGPRDAFVTRFGEVLSSVTTLDASNIAATSATLNGDLTSLGSGYAAAINVSFQWGTGSGAYTDETASQPQTAAGPFSANLTGLTPGTKYYYRAKVVGDGTTYGAEKNFTATAAVSVTTTGVTSVQNDAATLTGELTSMGTAGTVQVSFEWGATTAYGNATSNQPLTAPGAFSATITGLTPGTVYHYRARAGGAVMGNDRIFSTLSVAPIVYPVVGATDIAANSAKLNGNIISPGSAPSVSASFQWSTAPGVYTEETTVQSIVPSAPGSSSRTQLLAVLGSRFNTIQDLKPPSGVTRKIIAPSQYQDWLKVALETYGITTDNVQFVLVATPEYALALRNGVVDAVLVTSHPFPLISDSIASGEFKFLPWSTQAVEAVTTSFQQQLISSNLPAGTYTGQTVSHAGYAQSIGNFAFELGSLSPDTTYHFRAKVLGNGTAYSSDGDFTTSAAAPAVTTSAATAVNNSGATLNGNLTGLGGLPGVNVSFEYGMTTGYGKTTPAQAKTATGAFSAPVTGLFPSMTWHFRAKVEADAQVAYGPDMTFTTTGDDAPYGPAKFAYVSARDGNEEVYGLTPDAVYSMRLTEDSARDAWPRYTPDFDKVTNFDKVTFTSWRDGNEEIYTMNGDGTGQTRITSNEVFDGMSDFSWDGSKIAFVSNRDGNYEIYVMNDDGSSQTRLTNDPAADIMPAFSPDDTKVAFASNRTGNYEIYVMNADGSGVTRLTTTTAANYYPSWLNDGTKLVFSSWRDGNGEIYVMNSDGSSPVRLTSTPANDDQPVWCPTGGAIFFTSWRSGNLPQIFFMPASNLTGIVATQLQFTNDAQGNWSRANWAAPNSPSLSVTTSAAANISSTGATLNGNLPSLGGSASIEVSFEWGPAIAYGNATPVVNKTSAGTFSANITGLSPDTTYHFRARAVGSVAVYGADSTFTTLPTANVGDGGGGGGGGGGEGGGGSFAGDPSEGFVYIPASVWPNGVFAQDYYVSSYDGKVHIDIQKGTRYNRTSYMGSMMAIRPLSEEGRPPAPRLADYVSTVYELGPSGSFDPAVTLVFNYHDYQLPKDYDEQNLAIAYWDQKTSQWVKLENGTVDAEKNMVSGITTHFSPYALIAYQPVAAEFKVSDLLISDKEVLVGKEVTIAFIARNTGQLAGTYTADLKIDGEVVATKNTDLVAAGSQTITFTVARSTPGTATVEIDNLKGTYRVLAPASFQTSGLAITPNEMEPGKTVTVSLTAANTGDVAGVYSETLKLNGKDISTYTEALEPGTRRPITFTLSPDAIGTYKVEIGNLSAAFTVKSPPAPPPELEPVFQVSGLSITPANAEPGANVTIGVQATNTGGQSGVYTATLQVNGVVAGTQSVTLNPDATQAVVFTLAREVAGTYTVAIDELTGAFQIIPSTGPSWLLVGILGGAALVVFVTLMVYLWKRSV